MSRFRRLSGVDRMYLALETPRTPMHMGALAIVDGHRLTGPDGRLDLVDIRRRLGERVAADPGLRRVIHRPGPLAGGPIWIDDPAFSIERHVGHAEMPASADPDALPRFIERLMAPVLPRDRPLWRVWFVTGLGDGQVAVLFEVHHALADGLSAMRLARSLLAPPSRSASVPAPVPAPGPARVDTPIPRWRDLVLDNVVARVAALRLAVRPSTARAILNGVRTFWAGYRAVRRETATSLNGQVGPRRRLASLAIDAAQAKRIARASGVGVNDVVLDLAAGGMRALLEARGEPASRLAPRVGIAVALPSAARADDSGNQFGSQVVALALRDPDPRRRLREVAAARDRAKRTQAVTGVTAIRVWTARFPPTRALMRRQRFINAIETYLPCPPSRMEILGAPVRDLSLIQPLGADVGLTFLASSYAGRVTVTVRTDPDLFPDLDVLIEAMECDWRRLALVTPRRPSSRDG